MNESWLYRAIQYICANIVTFEHAGKMQFHQGMVSLFFGSAKFQYLHCVRLQGLTQKRIIQQTYIIEYFHFVRVESSDGSNFYATKHGISKCVACKSFYLI